MSVPRVVHCKRSPYDVYIGREMPGLAASPWANPFHIGPDGTRDQVIARYGEWVREQPDLMARLPELKDKVLGCWCFPLACHGQVLLELLKEEGLE